ncbi:kinase-like protein [Phanerochaete sordida]|uniref:non-specific serine/threonine protein kinase n=1 Tax=Phanerochaete sordida TaxID=48140 RepID=A0A9P3G5B9_9APHY|nr:kinase-like protein [Phanerochaete sordida]
MTGSATGITAGTRAGITTTADTTVVVMGPRETTEDMDLLIPTSTATELLIMRSPRRKKERSRPITVLPLRNVSRSCRTRSKRLLRSPLRRPLPNLNQSWTWRLRHQSRRPWLLAAPGVKPSSRSTLAPSTLPPSRHPLRDLALQSVAATPPASMTPAASVPPDGKRDSMSASPVPGPFSLQKDGDDDEQLQAQTQDGNKDQISAADYDPSLDRREDEARIVKANGNGHRGDDNDIEMIEEEVEEEEDDEEDVDDMFAVVKPEKKKKVKKIKRIAPAAPALITTTLDSAADPEGYYQVILGEQLDGGRYQVFSSLGKGMFANVVKARVLSGESQEVGKEVAIKIIRSQESMYRAGQKEIQILNKLKQADPEDKKHIVRLERTFEHRGHLCLVFESLSMNLRDVVKRFGKDVGLNIRAVRAYAHQLLLALSLLKKCNIMHADIKPDNILVNEQKTLLKLCDLGSASDASENDITPYLVSRFYRAPEIILGYPYDPALDMWSIGCTLYELYTGKILFPGRSNNHMLLLMMELKGRFNAKIIKKAQFGNMYFDDLGAFQSVEKDKVTGTDVVRQVHITKPSRDLRARLMPPASAKLKDDEAKVLTSFIDLLDRCLALDPAKRLTPKDALVHPFIRGSV